MRPQEKGFLLLASNLGDPERRPLTTAQLRTLTARASEMEKPLFDREMTPEDLLSLGYSRQMAERIVSLLADTQLLDYYLARGQKMGCRPLTRISGGYPLLLRQRLGADSPGCLWAKGDISLLQMPGIALVGSRDLREENRAFARKAGREAAKQGFVLISGNARGADREAQDACLEAGGSVISVVADMLQQHSEKERVLYLSEEGYDSPFTAQRAISRNRVIHALPWRTLVAQAAEGSGGTWDGSTKNLRMGWSPLFCFDDGSRAVRLLCDMGAQTVTMEMLENFSTLRENSRNLFDQ